MSPLVAFLIVFALLMVALIKFKVTPSVGLFVAAIVFGLLAGMPMADVLAKIPAGFGNLMASLGLVLIFGSIFGDFLGGLLHIFQSRFIACQGNAQKVRQKA